MMYVFGGVHTDCDSLPDPGTRSQVIKPICSLRIPTLSLSIALCNGTCNKGYTQASW